MLTKDDVRGILPKGARNIISDDLIVMLNNINDPNVVERYKENFFEHGSILADGRYKLKDYAQAVRFITYRLMDMNLTDSWIKAFPDNYMEMVKKGKSKDHINAVASAYNKGKMVSTMFERSLLPVHVLNADIHQKAINKLAHIMSDDDASHRSQIDAASALLSHLKAPEVAKIQLDVTHSQDSTAIDELTAATDRLAAAQLKSIKDSVVSVQHVAESEIMSKEEVS